MVEHKILGGSLQVAGIPRSVVVPGSTVPPLLVVAAVKSWECSVFVNSPFCLLERIFSPNPFILPGCNAGVRGSCVPATSQDG